MSQIEQKQSHTSLNSIQIYMLHFFLVGLYLSECYFWPKTPEPLELLLLGAPNVSIEFAMPICGKTTSLMFLLTTCSTMSRYQQIGSIRASGAFVWNQWRTAFSTLIQQRSKSTSTGSGVSCERKKNFPFFPSWRRCFGRRWNTQAERELI